MVSVVIPVLDAKDTIGAQLQGLASQDYEGRWEVIIADNGSSDGTIDVVGSATCLLPSLTVVDASGRPGQAFARNVGVASAQGELLVFCDADDVVDPAWLRSLVEAARAADLVAGRVSDHLLNPPHVRTWRARRSYDAPQGARGRGPIAPACNAAIWGDVLDALGGWPEPYVPCEDVAISLRARDRGYSLGFAPDAVVNYRLRSDARSTFRQSFKTAAAAVLIDRDFPAARRPQRSAASIGRSWAGVVARIPLVASARRRGRLARRTGHLAGSIVGSLRHRHLYL